MDRILYAIISTTRRFAPATFGGAFGLLRNAIDGASRRRIALSDTIMLSYWLWVMPVCWSQTCPMRSVQRWSQSVDSETCPPATENYKEDCVWLSQFSRFRAETLFRSVKLRLNWTGHIIWELTILLHTGGTGKHHHHHLFLKRPSCSTPSQVG